MTKMFRPVTVNRIFNFYLPENQFFARWNMGGWEINDILIYSEPSAHDCPSDDHRFYSVHCNNISDLKKALDIGMELVSLLRGFYTILNEKNQKVIELQKVVNSKTRQELYMDEAEFYFGLYQELGDTLESKLTPHEFHQYKLNAKENLVNSSMYLAQKQENVGLYLLLKYFSMPLTWAILYKIMETLETIEKHHDKGWSITYTKAERTKFTNPANNFSLLQIDARHGLKFESLKPNSGNIMTLDEAKIMFRTCTLSYLKYKYEELKTSEN